MNVYVYLGQHLAELFSESEMFQTEFMEKIKTRFVLITLFLEIVPFMKECEK
jgi:hypothetical protein